MFTGDEKLDVEVQGMLDWRDKAVPMCDWLRLILSFKTKLNTTDPIMERAGPLRKDLEDMGTIYCSQCFFILGPMF